MRVHVRRIASPAIFHQNIQHAMRHRVEIDAVGLHDSLFFPELRAQIRVWHKVKCMKQERFATPLVPIYSSLRHWNLKEGMKIRARISATPACISASAKILTLYTAV